MFRLFGDEFDVNFLTKALYFIQISIHDHAVSFQFLLFKMHTFQINSPCICTLYMYLVLDLLCVSFESALLCFCIQNDQFLVLIENDPTCTSMDGVFDYKSSCKINLTVICSTPERVCCLVIGQTLLHRVL